MPLLESPKNQSQNAGFRFLSIGECMVEMAPAETSGDFRMGFAGDTFNTAWYMRLLRPDVDTGYFSRVGADPVSNSMLETMTAAAIDTTFVARSPDRTVGLYLISLKDGERSFSYWREQSAARQLADDRDSLTTAMAGADLVYFSGITVAILDPAGRKTLLDALAKARADGKKIAFDSNLRPRLWASDDEMRSAVMAAASVSDIVLPSYDDEAVFFDDADIEATAARYLNVGATTVVVKNGSGPVHFAHDGARGVVTPPPVGRVVDSTSAGDSFNAGFFAGLDRDVAIEDQILAASRVAGKVIGHKGALVPLDLDELSL